MVKQVLVFVSFVINVCTIADCYTCETPAEWLESASLKSSADDISIENLASANIRKGEKWPDGVVPYKFQHSLSLRDISEVRSAFDEYETKTCIRFQPWKEGDFDFLSLEVNQSVCGVAHVCKQGGYQFAQFGDPSERCRNKATMVHELAHTICLGHEQERSDRDRYLSFPNCNKVPRKGSERAWIASGIYDYSSQLHYECNWCGGGWPKTEGVTKCGFEAGVGGLSPLDVDKINELYDCQGCNRHRWRPANALTEVDKANMYNFGYKLKDGTPLYPCRAPIRWEVSLGKYDIDTKSCHIGGWSQTYVITDGVEVLTIPGGLNNRCSVYELMDKAEVTRENGVVSSLSFMNSEARGYVAYGSLSINGSTETALGKVWLWNNTMDFKDSVAELQVDSVTALLGDYKVLTCSLDETCLLKQSCETREGTSRMSTSRTSTKQQWSKKIVCYVSSWAKYRSGDGKFEPEDIDPHLCTHLVYSFAVLENNVINSKDPWGDFKNNETGGRHDGYMRFTSLKRKNPKLKTLIAIGGWNDGSKKYSEMVANSTTRRTFVDSIIPFLEKYEFDGLDLDWEYPAHRGGVPEDKENFSALVKELREEFNRDGNGYLLTAAVSQNPRTIEKAYEVPEISKDLDFLNVMCYDYAGFWTGHNFTGHHTRLYRRPENRNTDRFLSVNDTVTYWLQAGLPKEKLILGMGLYGRGFILARAEDHGLYAPATDTIPPALYSRQGGVWGYNEICEKFQEEGDSWKISINKHAKAPYAFNDGLWIGYEDVESIYYKAEYARNMDLGGAMVWSLDKDDFKGKCHNQPYILLRTIVTTLNDKPELPQRPEVVPEAEDDDNTV